MNTSYRLKIGDTVKIRSGNYKGYIGQIEKLFFSKSIAFLKNLKKVCFSKTKKQYLFIPIHFSSLVLFDLKENKESKINFVIINSKKYRYFKKSGNIF